jgi:hypothetical protein
MWQVERLVILTHQQQGLDANYFLGRMKRLAWEPEGREVLVHQGTRDPPDSELAILHVDLTRVPSEYLALARRYPRCLNGQVADIGKRRISRWLVREDDAYDGPVVVKYDLNHGGDPERRLRLALGGLGARLREAAQRWLPPAWGGHTPNYQLFHRKEQVPRWVWRRSDLVVERFFTEPRGELFAVRQWHFFADRGHVSTILSASPLVKWDNRAGLAPIDHNVPPEVWDLRRELGFDFGKFDFVVDNGVPVVFDTKPTPHFGRGVLEPRNLWIVANLASGLDSLREA